MQALTTEQYKAIIKVMRSGSGSFRANPRCAEALVAEANLGMRIGDILRMRLCDIVRDGGRYRLDITEEKTGKKRSFTVPDSVYDHFCDYAKKHSISPDALLFPIKVRVVQRNLDIVCRLLGFENISTHSFRKWYATDIYEKNGHDIVLVQQLLQHSSPTVTRRYIGISDQKIENAIAGHVLLA